MWPLAVDCWPRGRDGQVAFYLGAMVSRGALYGSIGRAALYAGLLHEGGSLDACADLPLVVWAVANANGP